jgi:hypothetical protein
LDAKSKADVEAATAEQNRLDKKTSADVARDDLEAQHRHKLEVDAAAHKNAANIRQEKTSAEYLKLFMKYHRLSQEYVGLMVVRCTFEDCPELCCAIAPKFKAFGQPSCSSHNIAKVIPYGGITKTRRIVWLMYFGLAAKKTFCSGISMLPISAQAAKVV